MTNSTNETDSTNVASNNRDNSSAWVIPIAVLVPLIFLSVVCIIWGRWVYKRGKKRYWQRVQNEHLMAYGATEDSGQAYGIGELYENKYYVSEQLEEFNKPINDHTIKGNEDERRKSLPREQNPANGKKWYEQTDDNRATTIPAAMASNMYQEDSGIISNRTSDNVSESTVVDKIDNENDNTLQERHSVEENGQRTDDGKETKPRNEQTPQQHGDILQDEQSKVTLTIVCEDSSQTTQNSTVDKILTTDV